MKYKEVTNKIIEGLQKVDSGEWEKPWAGGLHKNPVSGTVYSGVNVWLLDIAQAMGGYTDPRWVTYKQAKKAGGHVCKGESGSKIVYFNFVTKEEEFEDENGNVVTEENTFPLLKHYTVFNIEQCADLNVESLEQIDFRPIDEIDEVVDSTGAEIVEGSKAAYVPLTDKVEMPPADRFRSVESYYSTLFHELTHWTGHESRLDREMRFDKKNYAMEEMVAELSSHFLGSEFGIEEPLTNGTKYIKHWLEVLNEDPHAVFTVSREAKSATEFILNSEGGNNESNA